MSPDAQHQLQGQYWSSPSNLRKITTFIYFQFYLALENSLCVDYVTEKFWKVLPYNVIPVVLNGANMSNIAPKNSYIDFKDFDNSIAGRVKKGVKLCSKKCVIILQVCGFANVLHYKVKHVHFAKINEGFF